MIQFTLPLDIKQQRPVIKLKNGLKALLDTGAFLPVWTDDEDMLLSELGAKFVKSHVPISGFGGTSYGNLYSVTISVGKLIYPNMCIIANSELDTPFHMIFSATMFRNLIYEIDDYNHLLNISIPDKESHIRNLVIKDEGGRLHVFCNSGEKAGEDNGSA